VIPHGESRRQIARTLNEAYADGLLSQETFTSRVEHLLKRRVIDPMSLIGDLSFRTRGTWQSRIAEAWNTVRTRPMRAAPERLLALDWAGDQPELLIGRHYACDIVLADPSVSRRHARVIFRDGGWIIQDLASTNGTAVNGAIVGRCALQPGDHVVLGTERLLVD
jgi:FHA domain